MVLAPRSREPGLTAATNVRRRDPLPGRSRVGYAREDPRAAATATREPSLVASCPAAAGAPRCRSAAPCGRARRTAAHASVRWAAFRNRARACGVGAGRVGHVRCGAAPPAGTPGSPVVPRGPTRGGAPAGAGRATVSRESGSPAAARPAHRRGAAGSRMRATVTATELARRLSDVLNRVRYRGERFVVERNGEPVAVLAPPEPEAPPAPPTLRELVARLGALALPGEGYAADLEAAQAAGRPAPEPPAWPT